MVSNKDLGLKRPPSSYAIFASQYFAKAAKAVLRKRVVEKSSPAATRTTCLAKWHSMDAAGRAIYQKLASEAAVANRTARAVVVAAKQSFDDVDAQPPEIHIPACNYPWSISSTCLTARVLHLSGTAADLLGKGSYGLVYVVRDRHSGETFAMKIAASASVAEAVTDLSSEMQFLNELRHPNVLICHGMILHPSEAKCGLVLELAVMDLSSWLRRDAHQIVATAGDLMHALVLHRWRLLLQMFCGLAYCHDKGVLHGDLKPNNILLFGIGESVLKLADFGISKRLHAGRVSMSAPGSNMYTIYYRAVELLSAGNSMATFGLEADVWAAACTIFDMMAADGCKFLMAAVDLNALDGNHQVAQALAVILRGIDSKLRQKCAHDQVASRMIRACLTKGTERPRVQALYGQVVSRIGMLLQGGAAAA